MSFHLPNPKATLKNYFWTFFLLLLIFLAGNILVVGISIFFDIPLNAWATKFDTANLTVVFALFLLPWALLSFAFIPISKHVMKSAFSEMITSRVRIDFKRFVVSFFLWFTLCFCSFWFTKNDLVVNNFDLEKFAFLFIVSLCILPFQCLAEELFFRSFLLKWIGMKVSIKTVQILITGIIFGYLHGANPEVDAIGKIALLYYVGTGIMLGIVAVIDQGIELTTGFHFANNLFAAIIVSNSWQVFQTDAWFLDNNPPHFSMIDFSITFGGQFLFLFLCWAIFWRKQKIN